MATFGEKIRAIRFHLGFTQDELAKKLDVTKQVISKYENQQASPRLDTVSEFAERLNIELTFLINDSYTVEQTINALNRTAVVNFTNSPPETIKYSTPRDQRSRTILKNMRKLNLDGQDKVIEYSELLVESKQYENHHILSEEQSSYITDDYIESYSVAKAAAGNGAYNEHYQDTTYHLIKSVDVPKHDEQIDVKGNSMEPTIMDGDVAFLKFNPDCLNNRIYVIQFKDETFIKRCFFDNDQLTLVSDNPDYENIIISGEELNQTKVVAEVVGWTTPIE